MKKTNNIHKILLHHPLNPYGVTDGALQQVLVESKQLEMIDGLKKRLVTIQDQFIRALIDNDQEGEESQIKGIAGAISWATSYEYMLSVLRIQIALHGTRSEAIIFSAFAENGVSRENVTDVLKMISEQVENTEKSLEKIREFVTGQV